MRRKTEPMDSAVLAPAERQIRKVETGDGELLGHLLYMAYHGSIDDEGQTLEESIKEGRDTLTGLYGEMFWDASFFVLDSGQPVSASIVTNYKKASPLLAFSVTDPDFQRSGLAGYLIMRSLDALARDQHEWLHLYVTKLNNKAVSLYRKLGFYEIDEAGDG